MNDKKLDQNKIYGICSIRKKKFNDIDQMLVDLMLDKNVIYIEELKQLYKIVFEFNTELHCRSNIIKYRKRNIDLGFPSDDNISYIDRVIEYLESTSESHGNKIQKIKDKYYLVE